MESCQSFLYFENPFMLCSHGQAQSRGYSDIMGIIRFTDSKREKEVLS